MNENQFQCGDKVRVTIDAEIATDQTNDSVITVMHVDNSGEWNYLNVPKNTVRHAETDAHRIPGRRVVIIKGFVEEFYDTDIENALQYANTLVQEDDEHTPRTVMVVPEEFLNHALTVEYVGTRVIPHRDALMRSQDD